MPPSRRRTLPVENQFERLQNQWKNGQVGAGAWFWEHFKPIMLSVQEGSKELHLQCVHCEKLFSASNPSRTSHEHLKSGACHIFKRTPKFEAVRLSPEVQSRKKAKKLVASRDEKGPPRISGTSSQSESEMSNAASEAFVMWMLESGLPFCALEHPRFEAVARLTGIPPLQPQRIFSQIMDSAFDRIREEAESKLKKSGVYQLAAQGWKSGVITLTINLPDDHPIFVKSKKKGDKDLVDLFEEEMHKLDGVLSRRNCLGWISDVPPGKQGFFETTEEKFPWLANIPCQANALQGLVKDWMKQVDMFRKTSNLCSRIVDFFDSQNRDRLWAMSLVWEVQFGGIHPVSPFLVNALKIVSLHRARDMVQKGLLSRSTAEPDKTTPSEFIDADLWNCVGTISELVAPVLDTLLELSRNQIYLSQAMNMWNNVHEVVDQWCRRNSSFMTEVMDIYRLRYTKSYRPAMLAAYLVDPAFCVQTGSRHFLPDAAKIPPQQIADAVAVLKRLAAPNRGGKVSSEFNQWKNKGLPADFSSLVCSGRNNKDSCLSRCVPISLRKTVWSSCLQSYEALGTAAHRLLSMRATVRGQIQICRAAMLDESGLETKYKMEYIMKNSQFQFCRCVGDPQTLAPMNIRSTEQMKHFEDAYTHRMQHSNPLSVQPEFSSNPLDVGTISEVSLAVRTDQKTVERETAMQCNALDAKDGQNS